MFFIGSQETLKDSVLMTSMSSPSVETATPTVSLPSTSQTKEEDKEEEGATGNKTIQYKHISGSSLKDV